MTVLMAMVLLEVNVMMPSQVIVTGPPPVRAVFKADSVQELTVPDARALSGGAAMKTRDATRAQAINNDRNLWK